MNTIIRVENLVKKYEDLTAVNGISFEVKTHEIFGILGQNGAGKTTTLEIMETLREPTSGEVFIHGHSIKDNPQAIKLMIGVQLQQSGYYPNLRLVEILQLLADLYNTKIDPLKLLGAVGLSQKAKSPYKDLSGGQKQRFSIATTLINQPRIVFLDEPSTGLDPKARRDLWALIRQIRDRGTTIILTTHYMDEAEQLCDRVAIMDSGQIIALDTPESLIRGLLKRGFKRHRQVKPATLEDVFLNLTGRIINE